MKLRRQELHNQFITELEIFATALNQAIVLKLKLMSNAFV